MEHLKFAALASIICLGTATAAIASGGGSKEFVTIAAWNSETPSLWCYDEFQVDLPFRGTGHVEGSLVDGGNPGMAALRAHEEIGIPVVQADSRLNEALTFIVDDSFIRFPVWGSYVVRKLTMVCYEEAQPTGLVRD